VRLCECIRFAFRENHMRGAPANRTESNRSLFFIVFTRIGISDERTAKHLFRVGEVEAVFVDVLPVLPLIPFERGSYIHSLDIANSLYLVSLQTARFTLSKVSFGLC